MADNPYKPGKVKLDNVKAAKTNDGPHRGGNKYNQMAVSQGFMLQKPIKGHTQEQNLDEKSQARPNKPSATPI